MKRKNIEAAREIRLWTRDIVVPGIIVLGAAIANPEIREFTGAKYNQAKEFVNSKLLKRKEKPKVIIIDRYRD